MVSRELRPQGRQRMKIVENREYIITLTDDDAKQLEGILRDQDHSPHILSKNMRELYDNLPASTYYHAENEESETPVCPHCGQEVSYGVPNKLRELYEDGK
jgi:hypothetical protein